MTDTIERFAKWTVRLVISIIGNAAALTVSALILSHMNFVATSLGSPLQQAAAAAMLIGLINLLLRPLVLWISRPLGFFLLFGVGFLLNAAALAIAAWLLPGFELSGILTIILASFIATLVNVVIASVLNLGDEDTYYRRRIEAKAAATPFPAADEPGRKLVMLEIDGLSYHHLKKALADGRMPTLQAMIEEEGYVLSKVDCGIPSQTSACQAGIMFGDNDDIPAYRWYDKTQDKLIVSASDAGELNARYAQGLGLMRGGSSVSNMLNGDAYKSLMTAADLISPKKEEAKLRADDVYLLMLNPSFLLNTIVRVLGMVVVELWEGWQQRIHNVYPRLNRLEHFYPFTRAATSVFLRDFGVSFAMMDIVRGSPSIYVTWPGYDEVAHHSGPWTSDAFNDLARYDKAIARVRSTIKEKARGYYDLILLSDHGQSFGPTFLQRYGVTIKDFIEQQLPAGMTVTSAIGGDTGAIVLASAEVELHNAQKSEGRGRAAQQIAKQGNKLFDRTTAAEKARVAASLKPANVTAYGSGNLAQVYFDLFPRKITLNELNAACPGTVDVLVQHEGIGLVCGYLDDGTPVALGKTGERNLHTGEVTGDDPLLMYAPAQGYGASTVETRAWQTRRVMDFPHAGDLMLISTVYPDGTVAALEELIGSHGGMGGEQTDAFIFHPPDLPMVETRNAIDVFPVLNEFRGSPIPPPGPVAPEPKSVDWMWANLWTGLTMVRTWSEHVFRCMIPDREAFQGVVKDPLMTGPALLVGVLGSMLLALFRGSFLLATVAIYGAGLLLTRKGSFAKTTRAMGFAQSPAILLPLALYKPLAPVVNLIVHLLMIVGVWTAAAVAHEAKGWKVVVLPLIYTLVTVIAVGSVTVILGGAAVSVASVLETLGFVTP